MTICLTEKELTFEQLGETIFIYESKVYRRRRQSKNILPELRIKFYNIVATAKEHTIHPEACKLIFLNFFRVVHVTQEDSNKQCDKLPLANLISFPKYMTINISKTMNATILHSKLHLESSLCERSAVQMNLELIK